MLQLCLEEDVKIFQECFKGIGKKVSRLFRENFDDVSKVFQSSFKGVSRKFCCYTALITAT